ncbi:MAG: peptide ABC transporter substrate-binding protein [Candidatus Excrementavichristensenella sp.]|nr:peptide ABC transporter substrate-binding protein [Bacillota bacterium]NLL54633.1 peptide ABC transporter substrate-binding protein [Clostridiales bacterium]
MRKLLTMLLVLMMALSMVQAAGAEAAQEIVYALANEPDGIDPSVTNNSFASNILVNAFEGLVTYDTATGALIPGEAESYEISEDGLVYTFILRDGLKWSDGSDHTAQDYAYTIKRILTPATTAKYVNLVTDYVVGAQEYYDGVTDDFDTVGFKALDDKTIQITLKDNASHFIDILTMFTFSPVQAATVEANGDQWTNKAETYVTNGPFRVTELNMGESVVMEKNPHYYGADGVKLEKITFRYISDLGTSLMAYENGELHGMNTIPSSDYARLKAEDAGVVVSPSYGTVFYDINNAKAPFDNPLVRKALNLAVDRIAIIEDVVQTDAVPAFSYISPGYVVDDEDFVDGRDNFELSEEADPEAAQAALAEAGYPGGEGFPVLELSYYTNETVKKVVEAMAEMFETNLGITVNISNADWAIFYEDVRAGKYDVAAMGWSGDYLHPMTFMPLLKTGDESNNVFYSNPEYDALVEKGSVMTDAKAAMEVFREAEALACNEYPVLPLYYKSNMMLMHDNVAGYYVDPTNQMYLRNAYVVE